MNLAQEGDWLVQARENPQAFAQLYNNYFPKLYTYVSYRVARPQDAEDIVAETFLRVIRDIKAFQGRYESSFAAWLFRIAYNLINDRYRLRYKTEERAIEELDDFAAAAGQPEEIALQKEEFLQLYHLLGSLPRRRQEVITLKFFGGLRNQEIAQILGLGERTVAAHLCRGLEELQHKYRVEQAQELQHERR